MIIATGNPKRGLSQAINSEFEVDFFSRETGFDFTDSKHREKFTQLSLNYKIFFNIAKLENFLQTILLKEVYACWEAHQHSGLILNIGSTCCYDLKGRSRLYEAEKASLQKYSYMLARKSLNNSSQMGCNIKVAHLSTGWIGTSDVKDKAGRHGKVTTKDYCDSIRFLIGLPPMLNCNELSLEAFTE